MPKDVTPVLMIAICGKDSIRAMADMELDSAGGGSIIKEVLLDMMKRQPEFATKVIGAVDEYKKSASNYTDILSMVNFKKPKS